MAIQTGQPSVRFSTVQPNGVAGISFVPKVLTAEIDVGSTGTITVCYFPAGTVVYRADAYVLEALNTGTVELGSSGNIDALIDTADYSEVTLNAWTTNVGSSNAEPKGIFYAAAGKLVATVADAGVAITSGKIRFVVQYFEMGNMFASPHFSL